MLFVWTGLALGPGCGDPILIPAPPQMDAAGGGPVTLVADKESTLPVRITDADEELGQAIAVFGTVSIEAEGSSSLLTIPQTDPLTAVYDGEGNIWNISVNFKELLASMGESAYYDTLEASVPTLKATFHLWVSDKGGNRSNTLDVETSVSFSF